MPIHTDVQGRPLSLRGTTAKEHNVLSLAIYFLVMRFNGLSFKVSQGHRLFVKIEGLSIVGLKQERTKSQNLSKLSY